MELILNRQEGNQVLVTCDHHASHTFDLQTLLSNKQALSSPLLDPVAYGTALAEVLFASGSPATRALEALPERIMLVTTNDVLDAIPWEFVYVQDDFLVTQFPFVRGLSADQRIAPPQLDRPLHIVAIPSNPLEHNLPPLNIDGEWMRLKEIIRELPFAITLERTRPPTIEQLRRLVANQSQRVVHFMGHGTQHDGQAILCFEQEHGELDPVTAQQFVSRVRKTVFLVTLNACVSASPGETAFSNLAAALVHQKVPYALGMRFSIPDDDALALSRQFYSELARGVEIEEALLQTRLTLAKRKHPWVVGVPVLYTSLLGPTAGYPCTDGKPTIDEHQLHIEVHALPRAEGIFQGRSNELKHLGTLLTADRRAPLITIHGSGGQGKTALAREAIERFAFAWPGGIYATTLETLPDREFFVSDLARFLGIATQETGNVGEIKQQVDPAELERRVLSRLSQQRTLVVLDNAETLIEAVRAKNGEAIRLAQFLREQVPSASTCLLATSREFLGWSGEVGLEHDLEGLSSHEGALLFQQSAPQRLGEIDLTLAAQLSNAVDGHPLSLRLLAGAFNESSMTLLDLLKDCEAHLFQAEDRYAGPDHRHRTLCACLEMSVRYLDADLKQLFSKLWLFHAPFLPDIATAIFDPEHKPSLIPDQLVALWRRSLLVRETVTLREGTILYYRLLPTIRPYIERYLLQDGDCEPLQARFGAAYTQLIQVLYNERDRGNVAAFLTPLIREDLERAASFVTGIVQQAYLLRWSSIIYGIGNLRHALELAERALEIGQKQDQNLMSHALANLGLIHQTIGQPKRALEFYEQALPIDREIGDRTSEAATLNNLGGLYQAIGQPERALEFYEQALPIRREVGDRTGEAITLTNLGGLYQAIGQPERALEFYEQALPIDREIGDRTSEATTLTHLGGLYQDTGQPKRALEFYEQALPINREVGDRRGEANTLNGLGTIYRDAGQIDHALEFYEQALFLARGIGHKPSEAATLNNLGMVYQSIDQPQRALEFIEQALPIIREIDDRFLEAVTLNNLGMVYQVLDQPQRALEFIEQALLINREIKHRVSEGMTLNNLANVYQNIGQNQQALELLEQSLPIRRETADKVGEAATLNNLARVYQSIDQPQRALEFCEQALPIMRQVGNRIGEARTLNDLGILYRDINLPSRALEFCEQALPIMRQVGNRLGEAEILNNLGVVYQDIGQLSHALEILEQALFIQQQLGDQAGEAKTLNNLGGVYKDIGQNQQALNLYEQALFIRRELGDQEGEAATLESLGTVYKAISQPRQALEVFQQMLSLMRETGDQAKEAKTLNNLGTIHQNIGQNQEAMKMYEQALPLTREVGDRVCEAITLSNQGSVYQANGENQHALKFYEQALPIMREVGNQTGEAITLNNLAYLFMSMHCYKDALKTFKQLVALEQQLQHAAEEATGFVNMALLLYNRLYRPQDAIACMEQALEIMHQKGLTQDVKGNTIDKLQHYLADMRQEYPLEDATAGPIVMPAEYLQWIITTTISVMTTERNHISKWYQVITNALQEIHQQGLGKQIDADLFTAILVLLDGQISSLPANHPYAPALALIQEGIMKGRRRQEATKNRRRQKSRSKR